MSRNAGGTYSLPAGNPVVTNTTITVTWGNSTCSDIGAEITNSLDRYGRGGMLAPLQLVDGVLAAPGLCFTSDPTTGFARLAAGTLSMICQGVEIARITNTGLTHYTPYTLAAVRNSKSAPAITANVLTLDMSTQSYFDVALNANITTLTVSNPPPSGTVGAFIIVFTADGTLRTITWPASFKWANGIAAPTMTSTNGKQDSFIVETRDAGATYIIDIRFQNT
jgi:hypothetical protein